MRQTLIRVTVESYPKNIDSGETFIKTVAERRIAGDARVTMDIMARTVAALGEKVTAGTWREWNLHCKTRRD